MLGFRLIILQGLGQSLPKVIYDLTSLLFVNYPSFCITQIRCCEGERLERSSRINPVSPRTRRMRTMTKNK